MEKVDVKEIVRHRKQSHAKMSVRRAYRRAAKRGKGGKQTALQAHIDGIEEAIQTIMVRRHKHE